MNNLFKKKKKSAVGLTKHIRPTYIRFFRRFFMSFFFLKKPHISSTRTYTHLRAWPVPFNFLFGFSSIWHLVYSHHSQIDIKPHSHSHYIHLNPHK